MSDRLERMRELVSYLNKAAHAYYVMDDPEISDMQYDKLYDELRALEAETKTVLPDSPTVSQYVIRIKEFEIDHDWVKLIRERKRPTRKRSRSARFMPLFRPRPGRRS